MSRWPSGLTRAHDREAQGMYMVSNWGREVRIQLFWERLSGKVHATILKGIVGDFKCTVFQRNLKESYGRPLIYVCECWRKVTKVGSTATVVRNSVLIISHITFRDCRVHFILDKLSRNSCILKDIKGNSPDRSLIPISVGYAHLWLPTKKKRHQPGFKT